MTLTHHTIYISFRLDFICIFAVRKPQKIAYCKRMAAVDVEIPQNPLSLSYDILAVFAPILPQKPSFERSFAPVLLSGNSLDQWFSYFTKYFSV